ncbi:hypothetical protein DE153_000623 [Clostridium beijerinckii]|uniref:hypothetical protein n=1 Tax=Clostridium beijerinckii TaxID=1520 RepID=UPI001A9BBADB|nr:hypothetical protein [Clostridium beijerinckii]NRX73842.1 hypothetical protein [Clostridium beijerinckii]NRY21641.1 hypothetical protein [Clostridium beijerinckii]NRZ60898.1 hypothetical protein [Clostridium beijerinckii]
MKTGKKKPSLELIEKYSEVFRIKPSTILFFSEEIDQNSLKGNMKELMIRFMKIIERFGGLEDE